MGQTARAENLRVLLCLACVFCWVTSVSAQTVKPVDAFSNAICNKTAGQSLKGEVISASLVKEEGAGILVGVGFPDHDPGQEVSFRAQLMKEKRNVGSVETQSNLLSESSGTVTLAINLKPSINGEAVESDTLVIHAFEGKKLKHQNMFRLERDSYCGFR